ncbi:MAG: T9SS type A sorting domain-containing protein [Cytophagales bacterium]|nr:T9SS type A sorting domain-containing protein [Cytophagales bacterium]
MHNKLIILTFALALAGTVNAQESEVVSSQSAFSSEVLQENVIDIYPNPAVRFLIINVKNSTLENTEFEMHSIIGNRMTITVQDLGQGRYSVPVEHFATGYYFLVVKDEETRFKRAYKFLKD